MSIASEITRIKTNISNAYTKLEEKGATIPEAKNSENLTACIDSVSVGGGGSATKYGIPIGAYLGDVDENGMLQKPNETFDFVGTGIKDIGANILQQKFSSNTGVAKVSFPDLVTVSGTYALQNAFQSSNVTSVEFNELVTVNATYALSGCFSNCKGLTSANLNKLTTISNSYSCQNMFYGCSSLSDLQMDSLTTIDGSQTCRSMFESCKNLKSINLDNLTTIKGTRACYNMFRACTGLTSVSFPSLTTISSVDVFGNDQTSCMFYGSTGITEIHFRADMQSVIEGLTAYQWNLGATNATIYYDL